MAEPASAPVARSPIRPAEPVAVVSGWEVSQRRSRAALRLGDRTPLPKLLVYADADDTVTAALAVPFGRARRDDAGTLVVGAGPGEWLLLGVPPGERLMTAVDVTHGRALMRLTGRAAPAVLQKVCAVDLADHITPDGSALRSSVAKVATDVIRDDRDGTTSYLLHCERSSGQYLFDALLDAGSEYGIDVEGFFEGTTA